MENFQVLLNSLNSGSLYLCNQVLHQKTIQNQIKPSPLHQYRWSAPDKNLLLISLYVRLNSNGWASPVEHEGNDVTIFKTKISF